MSTFENLAWCRTRANKEWGRRYHSNWGWIRYIDDSKDPYYEIYWRLKRWGKDPVTHQYKCNGHESRGPIIKVFRDRTWVKFIKIGSSGDRSILRGFGIEVRSTRVTRGHGAIYCYRDQELLVNSDVWLVNGKMEPEKGVVQQKLDPNLRREFYRLVREVRFHVVARDKLGAFSGLKYSGVDYEVGDVLTQLRKAKDGKLRSLQRLLELYRPYWGHKNVTPTQAFNRMIDKHRIKMLEIVGAVTYA